MSGRDHNHHHHHHEAEEEEELPCPPSMPLYIFDSHYAGERVPEGFNTVRIALDGTLKSDLAWKREREVAQEAIAQGLKVLWEIDLGLFDRLKHPLDNQTQFLSLSLSLEHFRDSLWKEFKDHTAGIALYRGDIRFDRVLQWNDIQLRNLQEWMRDKIKAVEEITPEFLRQDRTGERLLILFCRDAVGEYLDLLASRLPDQIECFVMLDASEEEDTVLAAQLLSKERYPRLRLIVKGAPGLGGELGWEDQCLPQGYMGRVVMSNTMHLQPSVGLCLPSFLDCREGSVAGFKEIIESCMAKKEPFKIIPEAYLTTEWDGLDTLYINEQGLTPQGQRKLQGFKAAGGVVHHLTCSS